MFQLLLLLVDPVRGSLYTLSRMDKAHGFCAAISKDDMQHGRITIVPTLTEDGTSLYSNIREAFASHPEYEQVFSGLTHNRRDVLVLDFDEVYTEAGRSQMFQTCELFDLPCPSYIEIHANQHWQAGWWLDSYFTDFAGNQQSHIEYNLLISTLASLFRSDMHFTGGWIKNPFFQDSQVIEYSRGECDTHIFLKHISKPENKSFRVAYKGSGAVQSIYRGTEAISRNCIAFNELRTYVFRYRKQQGYFPSPENCYSWMASYETSTMRGQLYGIEDPGRIWSTVYSVLNWCRENYDEAKTRQGTNYRFGVVYEKAKKAIMYFRYKDLDKRNMTGKEIASKLGISPSYLSKIKAEEESHMRECLLRFTLIPDNAIKYTDMFREAESRLFV